MLESLSLRKYRGVDSIKWKFDGNTQQYVKEINGVRISTSSVVASKFKVPMGALKFIFYYFAQIAEEGTLEEKITITETLFESNCTVALVFHLDGERYEYDLDFNNKKVSAEFLCSSQGLLYSSNEVRDIPRMPKGIGAFFQKLLCVDLTLGVDLLVDKVVSTCRDEEKYLEIISNYMVDSKVTTKKLMLDYQGEPTLFVYDDNLNSYEDIKFANRSIQSVIALIGFCLATAAINGVMILNDVDNLDYDKMSNFIKFFNRVSTTNAMQLIILDKNQWNHTNDSAKIQNIVMDYDDNYILSTDAD